MRRLLAVLCRRPWRCLSVLIAVLVLGGVLASQAYPWYHLRAGREAVAHYRTNEARRHLDACLQFWPQSTAAHVLAARAARRAGDYDAAERHLDACESTDGTRPPDVVFEWALLSAVKGDLPLVVKFLRARAEEDPAAAPLSRECWPRATPISTASLPPSRFWTTGWPPTRTMCGPSTCAATPTGRPVPTSQPTITRGSSRGNPKTTKPAGRSLSPSKRPDSSTRP